MPQSTQQPHSPQHHVQEEQVLAVPTTRLFSAFGYWQGLTLCDEHDFAYLVKKDGHFIPRSKAETDPNFKQIIPYLVFCYGKSLFLMQRAAKSQETRLHNLYTLGIGGHIRQNDIKNHDICDWAKREFDEEICYQGTFTATLLGMINDDSNEVGKVHVGCVYLLTGDSNAIAIKDELASGSLVSVEECINYEGQMETWSRIVLGELLDKV